MKENTVTLVLPFVHPYNFSTHSVNWSVTHVPNCVPSNGKPTGISAGFFRQDAIPDEACLGGAVGSTAVCAAWLQ